MTTAVERPATPETVPEPAAPVPAQQGGQEAAPAEVQKTASPVGRATPGSSLPERAGTQPAASTPAAPPAGSSTPGSSVPASAPSGASAASTPAPAAAAPAATTTHQPFSERPKILRPEREISPSPAQPSPRTPVPPAAPSSGVLVWSGELRKGEVVTLDGGHASTGTLQGALPGVPVTLETDYKGIGFAEMPGPSNGWKRVSFRALRDQKVVITLRWKTFD